MLEVLLIIGILTFILWLFRPKFEVQVSSKTIDELIEDRRTLRDKRAGLYTSTSSDGTVVGVSWRRARTVVEFIPIEKSSFMENLMDKLKLQGYRALTPREINGLCRQYSKKKEFNNFTVLSFQAPKERVITGDIICLQWQDSKATYSKVKHRDMLHSLILKSVLGESLENKFFIAVTTAEKNLWSKLLDRLYNVKQTFLHRFARLLAEVLAQAGLLTETLAQIGCFAPSSRIAKQLMNGKIEMNATKKSA